MRIHVGEYFADKMQGLGIYTFRNGETQSALIKNLTKYFCSLLMTM
jgi:hypothetical protein